MEKLARIHTIVLKIRRSCAASPWVLLLFVFLSLLCVTAQAQAQTSAASSFLSGNVVRPLPPEVALSQTRVGQIIQDDRGFLWIGTQYGLNRYDGFQVRQFLHNPAQPNSLGGSYIQVLFKDRKGNLWISCDQAFDEYDPVTETFRHFDIRSGISRQPFFVRQISEDQTGILWLGTDLGLIRFNPQTGQYKMMSSDKQGHSLFAASDIKGLATDLSGNFWVATRTELDLFDPVHERVLRRIPSTYSPAVTLLHEDRHHNFWAIVRGALYRMDSSRSSLEPVATLGGVDLKKISELRTMMEDRNGDMWFGTEQSGILHFNQDSGIIETFAHRPGRIDSLPSNRITVLFEDQRGDVWVGFHDTTPCMILRGILQFRSTAYNADAENGLFSPLVTTVFEETPNSVLIGTSGVLQRQDQTNGNLTRPFPFLDGTDVLSIYRDQQQRLWFGTDKGLYRIDASGRRKQFGRKDRHESYLSGAHCERVFGDKSGRIWVATWEGFDLYHPESDSFTTALWMNKGENIYTLTQDPDGSFWFGTNMGVKHFIPESETVESFPYAEGAKTGPSDTRINGMLFDSSGVLWIGTQNGLDRLEKSSKTFTRVSDSRGLGGQVVSCIEEDSNHHLWLGTNQGVLRFTPSSSAFEQFTTTDGLPGMDLTGWGVCAKGNSQRLYFGGFSGLVSFQPEAVRHFEFVPKILITGLLMDGMPVPIEKDSFLPKAISYAKELNLPHNRSSFSIEFAALDFRDARVERFRYRLDGIDKTWSITAPGQHSISFAHLPPGDYTLHLQSAAEQNSPGAEGASLAIHIAPPWWIRWWMVMLYLLTLLFLLGLERHRKLKQVTAVYEARLEGRVRERTRLARDLHDTLLQDLQGLILRFQSYLLLLDEADPKRAMLIASLNRAEDALIQSRDAIQDMRSRPLQLSDLPDAFGEYAEELSFLSSAKVLVEGDVPAIDDCELDAAEVLQIGKEAIRNAMQHAKASNVWVRIHCSNGVLELSVEDDGIGLSEELASGLAVRGHWGIRGMRERAERLGARFEIRSGQLGGKGTIVTFAARVLPGKKTRVARIWESMKNMLRLRS